MAKLKSVSGSSTAVTGSGQAQKWAKENGISDGTYPQRPVTGEEV